MLNYAKLYYYHYRIPKKRLFSHKKYFYDLAVISVSCEIDQNYFQNNAFFFIKNVHNHDDSNDIVL